MSAAATQIKDALNDELHGKPPVLVHSMETPPPNRDKVIDIKPLNLPQYQVMRSTAPNLLFHGAWGTGKSHIGSAKAYFLGHKYDNNCVALVRRKRVDLKATLWKWFVDKILPLRAITKSNDTELYRQISNGTEFFGVGLDSVNDVNKLASREYGFIVVEEAKEVRESDFEEKLQRCLRLPTVPFHQILLLTNPDVPAHWINKRFLTEKWDGYESFKGITLRELLPPSYIRLLDQLTGIYKLRYRDGLWVAAEGLVYPFDPAKHVLTWEQFEAKFRHKEIPKDWERVMSVDFGFDNAFVCQWWAITPSDVWILYREIYYTHRTVNTHAKQILHFCKLDGITPRAICDHDAEDQATLREHGIRTKNAKKDRMAGQQTVYDKYENDKIYYIADALVEKDQRLEINSKPYSTITEKPGYIWTNKAKEDMTKEDDHGQDCERYAHHTMKHGRKGKAWAA